MSWVRLLIIRRTALFLLITFCSLWSVSFSTNSTDRDLQNVKVILDNNNKSSQNSKLDSHSYKIVSTNSSEKSQVKSDIPSKRLCAFMNVTDNASYVIYDREKESQGLEHIHSTKSIYENFLTITIEKKCEATICKLNLLGLPGRTRDCYRLTGFHDFTLDSRDSPDPLTDHYVVSTGCSCKVPAPGCDTTYCHDVSLQQDECGRLYKESFCSECRYDAITAISLKEWEPFVPTNGFWCQSYIIKDGCRLSISSISEKDGVSENVANYTGIDNNASLNYVNKPNPSTFTCICDVSRLEEEEVKPPKGEYTVIIVVSVVLFILVSVLKLVLQKCIRVKVEKKDEFDELIARFRNGFSKDDTKCLAEDGHSPYVSVGHLTAIQQPYQHKWEINRDDIFVDKTKPPLGSGEFGCVYLGELKNKTGPNVPVAVKVPRVSNNISCFNSVLDEIKMLAYIGAHPTICKLLGACTEDIPNKEVLIILEHCSEGNLKYYLRKHKSSFVETAVFTPSTSPTQYVALSTVGYNTVQSLSNLPLNSKLKIDKFKQMISWATQIVSALEFLSSKQVIHIDLAARNVFLNSKLECKIGDFGLSQKLEQLADYVRIRDEYPLPIRWMALESLTDFKFTTQSDVWSYGIILFEIFSLGDDPYPKVCGLSELIRLLQNGQRLDKPFYCSDDLYQIMLNCWDADSSKRPDYGQIRTLLKAM